MDNIESNRDPPNDGEWDKPFESEVVGIHTALLHTGQVLFFTYPSKEDHHHDAHDHGHSHGSAESTGDSAVLDVQKKKSERIILDRNIFCGGTSFLEDGRLFVAGGQYQTWYSFWDPPSRDVHTFNPEENKWSRLKKGGRFIKMKARWYPTCVTLADGRVLITSGRYSFYQINFWIFRFVNNTLQIFEPKTDSLGPAEPTPFEIDLYPFMHLLPSGKVFVHSEATTRLYDPDSDNWDRIPGSSQLVEYTTKYRYSRTNPGQGTCVLLPLSPTSNPPFRARVMLIGGAGSNDPDIDTLATETTEIIDFSSTNPEWISSKPMKHPRVMPDGVILPDGKILVVNGSEKGKSDEAVNPVLEAELFDPESETWEKMCPMTVPRLYHATAILLPDARVLVAGTDGEWNKPPFNKDQRNIEIFKPPYLFRGERPELTDVRSNISYNNDFDIETPSSDDIASVVLIHPSSVTHSINTDQRYVGLEIVSKSSSGVRVKAPPNGNIAPPGYYMLFLVSRTGVPSIAKFLHLGF